RLRENEKGSASAKAAAASLEAERARLATERRALAEAEQTLASEESERVAMLDRTRAQHTQLTSRAGPLRSPQAPYEGCSPCRPGAGWWIASRSIRHTGRWRRHSSARCWWPTTWSRRSRCGGRRTIPSPW